ncbi:MAG TPA: glycosyltransferase 87 family protein [Candidatus Solibacter sp.]|nr:glycosyltransferase 87 family protein [Candidatus Solibacter sp.]
MLALVVLGTVARIVVGFLAEGVATDIAAYRSVLNVLTSDPFHVYSIVNSQQVLPGIFVFRWPYPPGLFPWILASGGLAGLTGLPLYGFLKLPAILADAALALVVQDFLGSRGFAERQRLLATALVAVGPSFAVISGYHGQFDSLAILPAVLATCYWATAGSRSRGPVAGLLIGVGAALKTVPGLTVMVLLPSARSWRERATLVGAAVAVPVLTLTPFALADPPGVLRLSKYTSLPGFGGPSLFVQPGFARVWLDGATVQLGEPTLWLVRHGATVTLVGLLGLTAWMAYRRTPPLDAAVLLWLSLYVLGPGFELQYLCWGLPFLLLAGHLRLAAAIEALFLVPTLILYGHPNFAHKTAVYVAFMAAAWLLFLAAAAVGLWRSARDNGGPPPRLLARAASG